MNKTDQQIILASLDEAPPAWWLIYHLDAKSQKTWYAIKAYFQEICQRTKSFFSGEVYPFKKEDALDEEFYELNTDQYIDLYQLIWKNWTAIKADLDFLHQLTGWDDFNVQSAGQCLKNIIREDCLCFYLEGKKETDFTNRSLYEYFRLKGQTGNFKNQENLTKSQKDKLRKFTRYQNRLQAFRSPHVLLDNCLATCKASKGRRAKILLRRYNETCSELDRVIQARNHPNRKQQEIST